MLPPELVDELESMRNKIVELENRIADLKTKQGKQGPQGPPGKDGKNGRGIESTTINDSGQLVITYTDGTTSVAGTVRGEDGEGGEPGPPGKIRVIVVDDEQEILDRTLPDGSTVRLNVSRFLRSSEKEN